MPDDRAMGRPLRRLRPGDTLTVAHAGRRAVIRRQAARGGRWADAPFTWDAYEEAVPCRVHILGYTRDACAAAVAAWLTDGVLPESVWAAW